jgi:hypothetical protein
MTTTSSRTLATENRPELCRLFWLARGFKKPHVVEPSAEQIAEALDTLGITQHLPECAELWTYIMIGNEVTAFAALTMAVMLATILQNDEKGASH